MSRSREEWWRTAFDLGWARMFAYKVGDAPREARSIKKMLSLPAGGKILDLCCGEGRISLQLARLGYDVTSLDLSPALLDIARQKSQQAGYSIRWLQQDMRDIGSADEFDAIVNMSTSFGYFQDEQDNLAVLRSAAKALKNGGRFLMDLENVYNLAYYSRLYGSTPAYWPVDRFRSWMEEVTLFDPVSHTINIHLRLWHKEKLEKDIQGKYRVYSLPEIRAMMETTGLYVKHVYGDFRLRTYSVDSPRMIVLAEKSE